MDSVLISMLFLKVCHHVTIPSPKVSQTCWPLEHQSGGSHSSQNHMEANNKIPTLFSNQRRTTITRANRGHSHNAVHFWSWHGFSKLEELSLLLWKHLHKVNIRAPQTFQGRTLLSFPWMHSSDQDDVTWWTHKQDPFVVFQSKARC